MITRPSGSIRVSSSVLAVVVAALLGFVASADVRPAVRVQLADGQLQPARSGSQYDGTLILSPPRDGTIETVEVGGDGWSPLSVDFVAPTAAGPGNALRVTFQARVDDASKPLEVSVKFDGTLTLKRFHLSPEKLAQIGRDLPSIRIEAAGPVSRDAQESDPPAGPRGCDDQLIRVRGRIEYVRPDGQVIGADGIHFQIMDEDTVDSEVMFDSYTDPNGNFDVTICWDDCDASGCDDPDIYLRYECDTGVAIVRNDDAGDDTYAWSTIDTLIFDDYEGGDIDFGTQRPSNAGNFPALHIHNSIIRAHRFVLENAGYYVPQVVVVWQDENGAFYTGEEIHIGPDEQWNEGTQVHEWGHHLLYDWTSPLEPDYCNGFCDDSSSTTPCGMDPCIDGGGHCVWCAETDHDAWNEGFPNWLGSVVMRNWVPRYGGATPTAINDGRYTIETLQNCCDGTQHNALTTENFVGALLRDMEDPPQDPGQTACPQDAMAIGSDEIFAVVREYQPIRVMDFISSFRAEYPDMQHDFRSTAQSIAAAYVTGWSLPPLEVRSVSGCGSYRTGETITLSVQSIASRFSTCMQWRQNGLAVTDGPRISGATTDTLVITNAQAGDAGRYELFIRSCDGGGVSCNGSDSTTSPALTVRILNANQPGSVVTGWGRNDNGMLGRGPGLPGSDQNPGEVVNLTDVIAASAGYWNSAALRNDGTVWMWGTGPLGNGTSGHSPEPVQVNGLSDIVAVHAGGSDRTTIALDANGHVWTWGSAFYGQLGYPQPSGVALNPGQVDGLDCVVDVSIGWTSAAAVTSDGTLWTWGSNYNGQLGLGVVGGTFITPQRVTDLANVVDVDCGGIHILARLADGSVWAAGSNLQGQIGDGTQIDRPRFTRVINMPSAIAISAGGLHSFAIQPDGSAWGWGMNGSGELGVNFPTSWNSTPLRIPSPASVRSLDAGYGMSLFVDSQGTIHTCGSNSFGGLGRPVVGNSFAVPMPVDTRVGAAISASAGGGGMMVVAPGARIIAPIPDQLAPGCSTVQFSASTVGVAPLSYQWRRMGVPLVEGGGVSGVNTPTLTIAGTDTNDTDTYDVVVSNTFNTTTPPAITLITPGLLNPLDTQQQADAWWSNERGNWSVTNGAYAAGAPNYFPATYSSFRLPQRNFSIECDVINASIANFNMNGGVWLHSGLSAQDPIGLMLTWGDTSPWGGGDIYWHRNLGGGWQSAENIAQSAFTPGQTVHLRIEVRGNTYAAFVNDSPTPVTTYTTSAFTADRIALLDNAAPGTAFDNIFIQSLSNCPPNSGNEPVRITQRPTSQSAASGAPVTLSVTATGTPPLTYQWLRNGLCIPGANDSSISFAASASTTGRYECTVTNACGSVGSYPATVAVSGGPPGDLNGDGSVGLGDLTILLSSFGACVGDPGFTPAADINGDGCVALGDLTVLLANFGT